MIGELSARVLLGMLWLFQHLPLGLQATLGRGLGRLLHARHRRDLQHDLALCCDRLGKGRMDLGRQFAS